MTGDKGLTTSEKPCRHRANYHNPEIGGNSLGNTIDELSKKNQERKFHKKRRRPGQGPQTIHNGKSRAKLHVVLDCIDVCGIEKYRFDDE